MKIKCFLIAVLAAAIAGCTPKELPKVFADPSSLSVESTGGTTTFKINSNTAWDIFTDGATWFSVDKQSGEGDAVITVTVQPYTEALARSGSIKVIASANKEVSTVAIVQNPPAPPQDVVAKTVSLMAAGGEQVVDVPAGYTIQASSDKDWLKVVSAENGKVKISADPNETDEYRNATVKVTLTNDSVLSEIEVTQSWRNVEPGELLIEEVYFTGSPIEGSTSASKDQYIKLTNNADHVIYADRVMFVMNYISGTKSSVGAYTDYPELEDGLAVSDMYLIPGEGTEHPLNPGESIILAIHAQNYKQDNPNAIDLSKADFEFFDGTDHSYPDTDNPDVPNLVIWFKSSLTITQLHARGLESYAIVIPPISETADALLANRHWEGEKVFHFNEYTRTTSILNDDVWVIPGDWVLDAVNCSLSDLFYRNPWGDSFDSGWTYCGDFDGDTSRFGKSVLRKTANNKLVDTNNSTNDFTPNNPKPTLAE